MANADRKNRIRCAIYTRKSSEEGLEQDFNSLDAQREASEAFIASQHHEGWRVIDTVYDDGGVSGGTMDRPALQTLFDDIRANKIDIVVVYKVDRLTRSLGDFAKMVDIFDAHGVSFVSVTQQFNTTSSMGRLTLNVLLSFAQFEREVTGERIRDKIAASKKKGLWMGGYVPLGYEAKDRTLVINDAEAETVREVFGLYRELGCVRKMKEELDRLDLKTKIRIDKNGRRSGGTRFSRGHLYQILSNPIYIGRIVHQAETYDGQHPAIIDLDTWHAVQDRLSANRRARRDGARSTESSLLTGMLFDGEGVRFIPTHTLKDGKRYRYYVAQAEAGGDSVQKRPAKRIPAHEIETLVLHSLHEFLSNKGALLEAFDAESLSVQGLDRALSAGADLAKAITVSDPPRQRESVQSLVQRIAIGERQVTIEMRRSRLHELLCAGGEVYDGDDCHTVRVPVRPRTRGPELKLVIDGDPSSRNFQPDRAMIKAVVRAREWFERLLNGDVKSIAELAASERVGDRYVSRILPLAFLAPDITRAILDGRQPVELNAAKLTRPGKLPADWHDQRTWLEMARA